MTTTSAPDRMDAPGSPASRTAPAVRCEEGSDTGQSPPRSSALLAPRRSAGGSGALLACGLTLALSAQPAAADELPDEPVSAERLSIADDTTAGETSLAKRRRTADPASDRGWEQVGDYAVVGGDMLIGKLDADGRLPSEMSVRGFGHSRLLDRWPDGIVPFELDEAMSAEQRERVLTAIEHWTEKTRMSFAERGTERADVYPNWLRFIPENGCASFVGRATFPGNQTYTGQPLYAENCTVGSIVHEIGHAIGLYHEHTRPDRDNFIQVELSEVASGREHNFDIVFTNTQTYGDYDYGSIMHYGERFFSRTGNRTIIAPDDQPVGQRVALSDGDITAVNRMYATDLALDVDSEESAITAANGSSIDGIALDVVVRNGGSLGAHGIELDLFIGDGAQWLSVTEDSGWTCASDEARLRCTRDTLAEGDASRFSLHLDPGTHGRDDLVVQLRSRTQDLDASNNEVRGRSAKALATREDTARSGEPMAAAASPENLPGNVADGSDDIATASSGSGGGGGGVGFGALMLTLLCAARGAARRRIDQGGGPAVR